MNQDMDLVRADMAANSSRPMSFEGQGPDRSPQDSTLSEINRLFHGRYILAVLLCLIGLVGGAALGWYLSPEPEYRSDGMIRIASALDRLVYSDAMNESYSRFDSYLAQQALMLRSQQVVDAALVSADWKKTGRGSDTEAVQEFRDHLTTMTGTGEIITVSFVDPDPEIVTVAVRSVIKAYQSRYGVQEVSSNEMTRQELIKLRDTFESNLTTFAEDIDTIAEQYDSEAIDEIYSRKLDEVEALKTRIGDIELDLRFWGQAPIADPENAEEGGKEPVDMIQLEIDKTNQFNTEELAILDPKLRGLIDQLDALAFQASLNIDKYGPNHRTTLASQRLAKALEVEINNRSEWVRGQRIETLLAIRDGAPAGIVNQPTIDPVERGQRQLKAYQGQMVQLMGIVDDIRGKRKKINDRRKQHEETLAFLAPIKDRLHKMTIEGSATGSGRIEILSEGDTPYLHDDTRIMLAALGGFAGAGLGFGIILLVGFMDQRFNSAVDARYILGHTKLMGILPSLPDDLSEPEQASMASHSVHHIRSLMQIDLERAHGKVTLITSPESQDGKTSLTLALGLSFAESGAKTLLVDCDLVGGGLTTRARSIVRRKIGRILEREGLVTHEQLAEALLLANSSGRKLGEVLIELNYISADQIDKALTAQENNTVGLMDAMGGESLDACIADTGVANLRILPVGSAEAQHASKLSPMRLRKLLDVAREDFDIVLIDTGPLGGSLEASVIAAEVDATLIVASRGVHRAQINRMLDQLNSLGSWVMGVVFNRADQQDFTRYNMSMSTGISMGAVSRKTQDPDHSTRFGPMANAVSDKGDYRSGPRGDA